jgi:hypothetical protein
VNARSKFEQNNLNSHEPLQASDAAHEPNLPLCGVGDHVWRFCVHGDTPNGQTWSGGESVSIFRFWILYGQEASADGTLHVKPDLVDKTIETLTWLESSWKELEGPSLCKVLACVGKFLFFSYQYWETIIGILRWETVGLMLVLVN